MAQFIQPDSISPEATDSSGALRDTAAVVHNKEIAFLKKEDLLQPSYILHYDSLTYQYALDSSAVAAYRVGPTVEQISKSNGFLGDPVPPMLKQQDSIFLSLMLCFSLICMILQRGYRFFFEGLHMLVIFREKRDTFDDITFKEFWGNLFLVLLPSFLIALLSYQYLQNHDASTRPPMHHWLTICGFTLTIACFLFFKYLYYLLIGYAFEIKDFIDKFLRIYLVLLELFGILVFIPTLIFLYGREYQDAVLVLVAIMFITTRIILFSRLIVFFFNKRVNFLFGIAYLCSVEILPYAFIVYGFSFLYKEDFFCIL